MMVRVRPGTPKGDIAAGNVFFVFKKTVIHRAE